MSVEIQVPRLAESISDAVLAEWLREDGAAVRADEPILTLETDKAAVEIAASESGVLRHAREAGEQVHVGDVLARIEPGGAPAASAAEQPAGAARAAGGTATPSTRGPAGARASASAGAGSSVAPGAAPPGPGAPSSGNGGAREEAPLSPAVRRLVEEHGLEAAAIPASGKGGRLLKEDVLRHLESQGGPGQRAASAAAETAAAAGTVSAASVLAATVPATPVRTPTTAGAPAAPAPAPVPDAEADERVVPMSRIRQRIAERLVQAQQTAAILTTFNEIDMSAVLELRARHKQSFEGKHGVRLGFMGFFTRACVLALENVPELNAEIRGADIVYHRRVHMGIAVGTDRGLVVPVVRDAHLRSLAGIEREIERLAGKARANTLALEELIGGTFTISNGGVYGSLFSTPILNPPQSGILGMHKIVQRPVAVNDQVAVRPMMYVALSYDHRIVDGEQAVTFLVRVKERLEDPERMLLEI